MNASAYCARLLKSALCALFLLSVSTQAAEQITYYHFDALGSPVAATDEQGNVLWRERYEPYGDRIKKEPAATTNTRWYTGHPLDPETGLNYAGARYYDPVIGRFMGIDPKDFSEANPHSFNRYNYGNNNPYKYVDPDGQVPIVIFLPLLWAGGGAAISGGINATVQYTTTSSVQWGGIGGVLDAAGDGAMLGPVFGATGAIRGAVGGARSAPIESTVAGERFVRVGADPKNLKWTFEHPGGTTPGTYAVPESTFKEIGRDPIKLKDLLDLPGSPPTVFRTLEPPPGTPIQRGVVPGGEFGGRGGAPEVFFPKGF